jgi:hypothetical protein
MNKPEPYPLMMDSPTNSSAGPTRDRWIALAAVGLAALLAAGWITRERQWATDLAESREDLRQAMHRLQTLTASTDQIRTAYLQRRSELEVARKKIDQLAQRQEERKRESSEPSGKKNKEEAPAKHGSDPAPLFQTITSLKLPSWTAVQKGEGMVRILPGVAAPAGNEGYAAFGGLARTLAEADSEMVMELRARAEPGPDALDAAQDRAKRLANAAERSLKEQFSRVRIVAEVAKGPRMEWRLTPTTAPAPKAQPAKP